MPDFLSAEQLKKIRQEIESGRSAYEVSKRYGIDKSNILRRIKVKCWTPRFPAVEKAIAASSESKLQARRDDAVDAGLLRRHAQDWKTIRHLTQRAIDSLSTEHAQHARACAEAVQMVHAGEVSLRTSVSRGRLRARPLTPPGPPTNRAPDNRASARPAAPAASSALAPVRDLDALFQAWTAASQTTAPATVKTWKRMLDKLADFMGHRDPTLIQRDDVLRWRDALLASGMSARTAQSGYIAAPRAIFQFGVDNLLIPENPFRAIQIRDKTTKPAPRARSKAFSSEEARLILSASQALGNERGSHNANFRRWAPWLLAFTGARVGEIAQLRREDVIAPDGIASLRISPEAGAVKGKLPREVPLHPQIIEQGFLAFVTGSPPGYLFADGTSPKGLSNRKWNLADFVRAAGVTDARVAPNHGWRHRFKTLCRAAGIASEYHDAITGHRSRRNTGEAYGDYPAPALLRELNKLAWTKG